MPTYPYACTACEHRFEIVQAFTDDTLTVCDQCNGRLRKVFSSVGVVFKGSGFYRNDSRSAGATTPSSTGISADSSSSSEGGSDGGSTPAKSDTATKSGTSAPATGSPTTSAPTKTAKTAKSESSAA